MVEDLSQAPVSESIGPLPASLRAVIHEINNPLSSIIGNTQLLLMKKSSFDNKTVEKLRRMEADAIRIDGILKALRASIKE
ncbi:MAG: histidine kinase dimerization/phospho-acceptor domain-containing protein [Candidatus Eisenbacteria bacterium]|nr:histidine kinase dimerization/phospho-acceptor domain-containing protein [Candidatus Eisenbacteria bacterium]